MTRAGTVAALSALLLVLTGCATSGGKSSRGATIEDIGQRKSTAARPASPTSKAPTASAVPAPATVAPAPPVSAAATGPAIVGRDLPQSTPSAAAAESLAADPVAPVVATPRAATPSPALLAKLEPLPARSLPPQNNRAVASLLDSAHKQAREGRSDAAVSTLERALGIAPTNGLVWSRLAELHLQQGHYAQAVQMATKSNVLVTQPALQAHNWRILALAKEATGDSNGARDAQRHAEQLEASLP